MKLTVFVISAGRNPNLPDTLAAIERQRRDVEFVLKRITDVAPMSAAFQRMLDECETPYFVQCDEDMVLDDGALFKMLKAIETSGKMTAIIAFRLHDPDLKKDIYGVKIYKHEIVKNYPYNLDAESCEMEQLEQMQADGYGHDTNAKILGSHAPKWTLHGIFERYQNLMEKWKIYRYAWLESLPSILWERLQEDPSEHNMYAFLGAYTSISSKEPLLTGEKDWTKRCHHEAILDSWFHGPYYATLYATSRCNFRCPFCKRESCNPNVPDISLDTVGDLMHRFPSVKSVCICGFGEPLMHNNLLPIFQYLQKNEYTIGLITNGSLLKSVFIPRLVAYEVRPHYVSVSLNASDPDEHEQLTGSKTWYDILEGIQLVQQRNIPVHLSRVCTTENVEDVPRFLDLAYRLKVAHVHLHNLLPYCEEMNGKPFDELVLMANRDEPLLKPARTSEYAGLVTTWPVLIDLSIKPQWCEHPWRFVGVDGNGHITLCNSVDHPNPLVHVKGEIWQSEYAQKLRERVRNHEWPCNRCFRNWAVT